MAGDPCRRCPADQRRGSVLVLSLVLMVVLVGIVAFAVDLGYLLVARTELQVSADAAAMAGAWELMDQDALYGDTSMAKPIASARATASQFAGLNLVCTRSPSVDENEQNSETGDVVVGTISEYGNPHAAMSFADQTTFNTVKVRVRRNAQMNGNVPFFFARIFGFDGAPAEATATAGFLKQAAGFRAPQGGENLGILPFALDLKTWQDFENGLITTDDWSWDGAAGEVAKGPDGIHELNLYPEGNGSPGNRGTVNIGGNHNSTSHVSDQILHGVTAKDLEFHGGSLEFGEDGTMSLQADPGISAGFKDALEAIKGEPRMIPIFSELKGNGNWATYTIVKFVGIRIVDVDFTGSNKHLTIQPAVMVTKGLIPASTEQPTNTIQYIYSPPFLIH
jgi:hypothetical protein